MEPIRFSVNTVSLDSQVGFIGFANDQHYYWMQPSETTTAKDEIWLERDDQQWGGCGGEWNIVLTRNRFAINTSQLPWMACDSIDVDFLADDQTYAQLVALLRQVMIDCQSDLQIHE